MEKVTVAEFEERFGNVEDVVGDEKDDVAFLYISEYEECPYIGVEYTSGIVWVYGARADHEIIDGAELEWYLSQEG